jgi:hypothetical protein
MRGDGWMEIFCFYEELAYSGIGDVVPRQSAVLPEYPNASIHQNHSDMTKFSGVADPGYVRVRGQLWLWVEAVNKRILITAASIATRIDLDERTLASRAERSEQAYPREYLNWKTPGKGNRRERMKEYKRLRVVELALSYPGAAQFLWAMLVLDVTLVIINTRRLRADVL